MHILSCGHQTETMDDGILITYGDECIDHTEGGYVKCIVTSVVCPTCKMRYNEWYSVFNTKEEADQWLNGTH